MWRGFLTLNKGWGPMDKNFNSGQAALSTYFVAITHFLIHTFGWFAENPKKNTDGIAFDAVEDQQ